MNLNGPEPTAPVTSRDQVGNMGVDVAMLEETLQNLAAQTEEANNRILQVTNFVVDLIERLEDIDDKARSLLDKWKEETQAISEFAEHADEMTERFGSSMKLQDDKMNELTELLNKLEGETKRLSFIPSKSNNPNISEEAEEATKHLLVEDPENVDFHAKRKAFYAIGEKMKTNDTFQTFKARRVSTITPLEKTDCVSDTNQEDRSDGCNHGTEPSNHETEPSNHGTEPSNHETEPSNHETEPSNHGTEVDDKSDGSNYGTKADEITAIPDQREVPKTNSIFLPILLCIIVAVVACLVVIVVNPDVEKELRTLVEGFVFPQKNGKTAT
ncbi:uncharacterized protein LOC134825091 isoform X2 [Bolinopsis microptera]|uniref:uncharacterized protein LOC134825091 isoform X2 n=1 Tax=Bolinopsis microptera TaxID=2820187 RepID=UPI003078C410